MWQQVSMIHPSMLPAQDEFGNLVANFEVQKLARTGLLIVAQARREQLDRLTSEARSLLRNPRK